MPSRLRARFFNILKVTFISGRLFSFNGVYGQQMEKIYCVIAKLEKYKNIIELKEDTKSIIDTLDRFFLICKISDFDFIKIEDVISKCAFKTQ